MAYLLFPWRHHMLTNFQMQELTLLTEQSPSELKDVNWNPLKLNEKIDKIIWVITSSNHSFTRRNPLPSSRREAMIEDFSRHLWAESFVFHIDDIGVTDRFADYVIKKVEVDSQGKIVLTPENTVVGCSTPGVISMYEKLWFQIAPFELEDRPKSIFKEKLPWDIVEEIIKSKHDWKDWRTNPEYLKKASRASRKIYSKYWYWDVIADIFDDPLLGSDGDITDTRDYNTYVRAFDDGAQRKYEMIKNIVKPGRIVDIGCCTWALIGELTRDPSFRESDFYGIEVARVLYSECLHRKENWYFANDNVFFYQRNVAKWSIFPSNSIDTFTTFSLTHEVESYQWRETLLKFTKLIHEQLKYSWKWINVDVVWPENWDKEIYLWLNKEDGSNIWWDKQFIWEDRKDMRDYLDSLSTYARFLRFARDFRHEEWDQISFKEEKIGEENYVVTSLSAACEYLSKKDYTDNWDSEMHERFTFFSFSDWKEMLESNWFKVTKESYAFANPWIIENRYDWKMKIFEKKWDILSAIEPPVTNMVMVAEK